MYQDGVPGDLQESLVRLPWTDITVVCIGTDRSTGDALGPLIGSMLEEHDVHVLGTLDNPVHAQNLQERIKEITTPKTLAVDACLGQVSSVGQITFGEGAIRPGAGVHKELPPIGNYSMVGIVNVGGFMEYYVLQNTRLSLVMGMAKAMTSLLIKAQAQYGTQVEAAVGKE